MMAVVTGRWLDGGLPRLLRLRGVFVTPWSDPVVGYDDVVARAGGSDAMVRAVALVDVEQKETLTSLYRGSGKAHALLLLCCRRARALSGVLDRLEVLWPRGTCSEDAGEGRQG